MTHTEKLGFLNDREMRLLEMGGSFVAAQVGLVNLEDLCSYRPGRIVRTYGRPDECIKVFAGDADKLGCVAGWISEDEPSTLVTDKQAKWMDSTMDAQVLMAGPGNG